MNFVLLHCSSVVEDEEQEEETDQALRPHTFPPTCPYIIIVQRLRKSLRRVLGIIIAICCILVTSFPYLPQ